MHEANHNEVEDNSITISKDKMFSLGSRCSLISVNLKFILTGENPLNRLFIQQERTVEPSIMLFVDMRRYKKNHPFFSNGPHYQEKGFQRG